MPARPDWLRGRPLPTPAAQISEAFALRVRPRSPARVVHSGVDGSDKLARPRGFEPLTFAFGGTVRPKHIVSQPFPCIENFGISGIAVSHGCTETHADSTVCVSPVLPIG